MSLRKLHETGRTLLETISVLVVIAILIIASLLGYDALLEYLKRKETVKQVTELSVRYKLQPVKPPRGKNNPRIKLIYPEANTKDGITIELPEEKARVSLLVFENACISYFLEPIEGLSKATCLEILNQNQYGGIRIGDEVRARESLTDEDLVEKGLCQSEMNSLTLVHSSTTGGSLNGYWYGDCYHHCQEGIPEDIYGNCCETQAQVDSYNKCGVCVCPDNGECCSNKLYCDETFFGECVGCMTDSHCKDDLICDPSTHRCVECYNDTHCRGKGADYKCDLSTNRCVKCKTGNGVSWNADLGICACTISLGNGLPCYSDNNCCSSGLCHNFGGIKGFRCVECLEQKDCRGNLVCLPDKNCGCPSGQTAYRDKDRDNKPACCVTNRLYDNNKKCCSRDLVNGVCPGATQCVFNNTIYDNGALIDFCNKCVNGEIRATNEGGLVGNCGKCNNGSVVADTTKYNSSCQTCTAANSWNKANLANGTAVGNCGKCQNGASVADTTKYDSSCQTCTAANSWNKANLANGTAVGNCGKCQNGASVADTTKYNTDCQSCNQTNWTVTTDNSKYNPTTRQCCPSDTPIYATEAGKCCPSARVYDNNKKCCNQDLINGVCPGTSQCVFGNRIYDDTSDVEECGTCDKGTIKWIREKRAPKTCQTCDTKTWKWVGHTGLVNDCGICDGVTNAAGSSILLDTSRWPNDTVCENCNKLTGWKKMIDPSKQNQITKACCPTATPYWNSNKKQCVECLTDAHCANRTDGKTICDTNTNSCVTGSLLGKNCSDWENNTDCGGSDSDYYCKISSYTISKNNTCNLRMGDNMKETGVCYGCYTNLKGTCQKLTTSEKHTKISQNGMNFWTANSFCKAMGTRPLKLSDCPKHPNAGWVNPSHDFSVLKREVGSVAKDALRCDIPEDSRSYWICSGNTCNKNHCQGGLVNPKSRIQYVTGPCSNCPREGVGLSGLNCLLLCDNTFDLGDFTLSVDRAQTENSYAVCKK